VVASKGAHANHGHVDGAIGQTVIRTQPLGADLCPRPHLPSL
jgi:hypothetical protein